MTNNIYKPYIVLFSDDERLFAPNLDYEKPYDPCWILVEVDPNGKIVKIIENDLGEPEDKTLIRDFSWVPELLNEQYNKARIQEDALREKIKELEFKLANIMFND